MGIPEINVNKFLETMESHKTKLKYTLTKKKQFKSEIEYKLL